MKKVAPVVQGAVLFNPIISLTNDVKVLASDEDIYENEAIGLDKSVSVIDIATLGAGCKVIKTTEWEMGQNNRFVYDGLFRILHNKRRTEK